MIWFIRKFWSAISATASLLGIFYVAAALEDREQAINAWGRVFTMNNLVLALTALCVVLLLRLWYMEARRALNDPDWPPVRTKVLRFVSVLFRRDFRTAQLAQITDDKLVKGLRRCLTAKRILEASDFSPVDMLPPPRTTSRSVWEDGGVDYGYMMSSKEDEARRRILGVLDLLKTPEIADTMFTEALRQLNNILDQAGQEAYKERSQWKKHDGGAAFATDEAEAKWHELRHKVDAINSELPLLKEKLESIAREWRRFTPDEETARQLLQDIAIEKLP